MRSFLRFTGSLTLVLLAAVLFRGATPVRAQSPRPPAITSISVCGPAGTAGAGSCPSGTFDTHQMVIGPGGSSVNRSSLGVAPAPDQHSTVFAPGTLGTNQDYLFFLASPVGGNPGIGVAVLSGGSGPDKSGQWTLDYPRTDGYGSYPGGFGQVFNSSSRPDSCPAVADRNPAHQDQTFDMRYAASGSVVKDPTGGPGSLLMVYEGTNACIGNAGGPILSTTDDYISLAIATSIDYGKSWPTYRGTPTFNFVPLPGLNPTQGPNAPMGALGRNVCIGNDCTATPPASYGRYPVVTPPVSLASLMAVAKPLTAKFGEQEISGFVDDIAANPKSYLYVNWDDARIARAQLNGGTAPLTFLKWDGHAFASPGIGGAESSVLPSGSFENCGTPAQNQFGSSIGYVDDTQQYLLTFLCVSNGDPALGQASAGSKGGAWFYSTSYDLSDQSQWTPPKEIAGSWSAFDESGGCTFWKGYYPTFMSLGKASGHLSTSGYVFYLWGCQGATPPPGRQMSARAFTITTAPAVPQLTAGSLANGATYVAGGLVPGSWAQVKGAQLSPVTRTWANADFTGLGSKLPTNLSGVEVKVNNIPAAVYFIDPGQISFQVPAGISGTASVQVTNNGQTSNIVTAQAVASAPGIFPVIVNGTNYPAAVFLDGKYAGDPAIGPAFRSAKSGDIIQLFATGLVATASGVLPNFQTVNDVTVTIGTVTFPADFAGLVAVGEFQINFKVPQQFATVPPGNYPISIQVNGVTSPATINSSPPAQLVLPVSH